MNRLSVLQVNYTWRDIAEHAGTQRRENAARGFAVNVFEGWDDLEAWHEMLPREQDAAEVAYLRSRPDPNTKSAR